MSRTLRALALGAALALAIPGAAFAATAATSRTETLTVVSAITMTGVSSTLAWGSGILAGTTLTDTVQTVAVSTDAANGFRISLSHSVLTSGANTIPITAFRLKVNHTFGATVPPDTSVNVPNNNVFGPVASDVMIQYVSCGPICSTTGDPTQTFTFQDQLIIPGTTLAGSYTGTIVYQADTL